MKSFELKDIQYLHLILGLFFTIAGFFTLLKADYIYSIWIISLGLFFLFDIIQKSLLSGIKSTTIKLIHYSLVLIVLLTGLITLFK